jgi:hypothetical protein
MASSYKLSLFFTFGWLDDGANNCGTSGSLLGVTIAFGVSNGVSATGR